MKNDNNDNHLLDKKLNKVLDLLYLSSTAYNQMKNHADSEENRLLLKNISYRRESLAQELEKVMMDNDVLIDKRTWSSTTRAFPPRSKGIEAKGEIESIDNQLIEEYEQLASLKECSDLGLKNLCRCLGCRRCWYS